VSRTVTPLPHPVDGTVRVPGSKSQTARLLVAAALANGTSVLHDALLSDDTERMLDSLGRLGVVVRRSAPGAGAATWGGRIELDGRGVGWSPPACTLDVGLAGTVARFLTPVAACGHRPVVVDGTPRMRERPMAHLVDAIGALGGRVEALGRPGHLPLRVTGPLAGGTVRLPGDTSSQFLSGLLLAAPLMGDGLRVELTTPLVSRPYVDMTVRTMATFGVQVAVDGGDRFAVAPGQHYRASEVAVEPDASAASYFYAAAAVTGSRLAVAGVRRGSSQGDVGFVDVLAAMGAAVEEGPSGLAVTGPDPVSGPPLTGVRVDMADRSDVVQTLAVVAPFAASPTEVTGVGFIRGKETDRLGMTVRELRRCGVDAEERPDGLLVHPSEPHGAAVDPVGDHRMAMSFAVLGLRVPGIVITDPGVTGKTFPGFFDALDALAHLPRRP
jgi:3-phosphoshikimate 1-carboxyvinyltransferase